jgi:hypothetical protein
LRETEPLPDRQRPAGLRAIAVYEAAKGCLVLLAGMGLLGLIHRDVQEAGEELVRHSQAAGSGADP